MRRTVEPWVAERGAALGVEFLPLPAHRSWTVSCLKAPASRSGRTIVKEVKAAGYVLGTGYGPLKETTFRIGHMGDHTEEGVRALLGVLGDCVQ